MEDRRTGEVVGTYRLQSGLVAAQRRGYYSAQEFDLSPFEPLRDRMIEMGRACVHSQHRNLTVLGLLWKGISDYARARNAKYLIGCSSLSSQDPAVGAAVYSDLSHRFLIAEPFRIQPLPELACPLDRGWRKLPSARPKLLSAYLSVAPKFAARRPSTGNLKRLIFSRILDLDALSPAKPWRAIKLKHRHDLETRPHRWPVRRLDRRPRGRRRVELFLFHDPAAEQILRPSPPGAEWMSRYSRRILAVFNIHVQRHGIPSDRWTAGRQ